MLSAHRSRKKWNRKSKFIYNQSDIRFVPFLFFHLLFLRSAHFLFFPRFGFVFCAARAYCFCERRYGSVCALISSSMAAAAFRCCLHPNVLFYTITVAAAAAAFSIGKKCVLWNVDVNVWYVCRFGVFVDMSRLKRHINCFWCMWRHLNDTYKTRNGERQLGHRGEKRFTCSGGRMRRRWSCDNAWDCVWRIIDFI